MSFADKTLNCRDCGNEFTWSAGEQSFYAEKGLQNQPTRCPDCRAKRKTSGGASATMTANNYGGSRERSSDRGERVQHPVKCASCGNETTVPFVPKYDRPVYCSDCFERERGAQAVARR